MATLGLERLEFRKDTFKGEDKNKQTKKQQNLLLMSFWLIAIALSSHVPVRGAQIVTEQFITSSPTRLPPGPLDRCRRIRQCLASHTISDKRGERTSESKQVQKKGRRE